MLPSRPHATQSVLTLAFPTRAPAQCRVPAPLRVSSAAARLFLRRIHRFDEPHADIASALAHHGYIQIDPINVCGRMHDLILRNRVTGYPEGGLTRFLHGQGDAEATTEKPPTKPANAREAFEHHLPDTGVLVAFTLEAWPHLHAAMRQRSKRPGAWSGRLTPRERELAPRLLAEIAARGPLGSEDIEDDRRAHRSVWGTASLVKNTRQKLLFHGRLLIAQRANNRRRYDLPERVLPARVLAQPEANAAETARWLAQLKLRQRRLTPLKKTELPLVADLVQPVAVDDCPPLYCLASDAPQLEAAQAATDRGDAEGHPANRAVRLLAPLDPMIYDRRVTAALWNFNYTWEVYTPPRKRTRGYYALPVLSGLVLVGHVDPKADRVAGRLKIVSRRLRRGHSARESVREFARWLGLR